LLTDDPLEVGLQGLVEAGASYAVWTQGHGILREYLQCPPLPTCVVERGALEHVGHRLADVAGLIGDDRQVQLAAGGLEPFADRVQLTGDPIDHGDGVGAALLVDGDLHRFLAVDPGDDLALLVAADDPGDVLETDDALAADNSQLLSYFAQLGNV